MSTETPVIRNFLGLESLTALVRGFQLHVNLGYGEQVTLDSGFTAPLTPTDIRDVGLVLVLNTDQLSLLEAVGEAGLTAQDIDLVVVAEGRFLKSRDIIVQKPILAIPDALVLSQWKAPRPISMLDKRHGFDIEAYLVLNKHIAHKPLRPRRLGTVLAEASYTIKPTKFGGGFVPRPLTDEVRGDRLPKDTVLWVEQVGNLFEAQSLDEAVVIYINERLHSDLGRLRTAEAHLLQTQFALDALSQIIFMAAAELSAGEISAFEEESVVGQYLYSLMQKLGQPKVESAHEALHRIKNDPSLVAAQFTSQHQYRARLTKLISGEEA
jgi:hypothetical protein